MLACARMGVIHSQVFGEFSGVSCGNRIVDSQSKILLRWMPTSATAS